MSPTLHQDDRFIPEGLHRAPRILVVDSDDGIRKLLQFHLKRGGCEVRTADSRQTALAAVDEAGVVDLVLLDLRLPDSSGLDTLRALNDTGKVSCVIVMTAFGTMAEAITALREGAYDFVNKTYSFDDVRLAIRNALNTLGLKQEVEALKMRLSEKEGAVEEMVGHSPAFEQMMKLVRKVADSDITVLIQGESGVGKELVARAIHKLGPSRQQPFVALNCAAIPETLLESELFGHEKGAFTGATARRAGKFQEAHEGTLFLDEIGELGLGLQAKLLRVLQTQEVQPIGGTLRRVKVRVISASNLNLLRAVEEGRFRADLYYRLAVFPIAVPPLRERQADIPLLLHHFVGRFAEQEGKRIRGVSREAMERLQAYPWLGNVRELENAVYRAVVLSESDVLTINDFPSVPGAPPATTPPAATASPEATTGADASRAARGLRPDTPEPPASPSPAAANGAGDPQATPAPEADAPGRPRTAPGVPPPFAPWGIPVRGGRGDEAPAPTPAESSPAPPENRDAASAPAAQHPAAEEGARAPESLEQAEVRTIREALAATGGNMSKAAVHLGIGRATLYRKSKKYGIVR